MTQQPQKPTLTLRKTGLRILNETDLGNVAGGYISIDEIIQTLLTIGACSGMCNDWSNVEECYEPSGTRCGSA